MVKRIFWVTVGYGAGLGTSVYVQRRVRRAVEHYTPEQVRRELTATATRAARSARDVSATVFEALREGRDAMRDTEAELRREFPPAPGPGRGGGADPDRRALAGR